MGKIGIMGEKGKICEFCKIHYGEKHRPSWLKCYNRGKYVKWFCCTTHYWKYVIKMTYLVNPLQEKQILQYFTINPNNENGLSYRLGIANMKDAYKYVNGKHKTNRTNMKKRIETCTLQEWLSKYSEKFVNLYNSL